MGVTLVRFWGTYLKSPNSGMAMARYLRIPAEKGWNTNLVLCKPPENREWLTPLLDLGIRIEYLLREKSNFDWRCVRNVYNLCRRLRCDIFHCDNMHTSPLIGAALAGVPVRIWSKRSMNPAYETERTPTLRDRIAASVRLSCWLSTRTHTVSRAVADELVELGIPDSKLVVLNNPIDKPSIRKVDRSEARAVLGYGPDEVVLSTVGHAVPVKGWDILLRSFTEIADKSVNARLLFVGSISGDHERTFYRELIRIVENNKLGDRVRFIGHQNDISTAIAASDVFILPSRSEGSPNALREALYGGIPSVSTRVGDAPELIFEGVNGYLVERGKTEELTRVLLKLVNDAELREALAKGTRNLASLPTVDEYRLRLFELYESLLNGCNPVRSGEKR